MRGLGIPPTFQAMAVRKGTRLTEDEADPESHVPPILAGSSQGDTSTRCPIQINESQKEIFLSKVLSAQWTLRGKRLAVLGLSYKGETDDIGESPAIEIVKKLLSEGVRHEF